MMTCIEMKYIIKRCTEMITMKEIIRDPHDTLRLKAQPVELPLNDEDRKTLHDIMDYLKRSQDDKIAEQQQLRPGVGIAAPQINISKQMIALFIKDEEGNVLLEEVLINPKIIAHSSELAYLSTGEGCLSVDEQIPGYVPRYRKVTVRSYTMDGEMVKHRFEGFEAIVAQHEIDHLNGVMFYDHINQEDPFKKVDNAVEL